jgi:acetyl-CoA acetyltransferase
VHAPTSVCWNTDVTYASAAGITSENVANRYGITREEQDEMAARSHARAAAAQASGRFNDEIVPVHTTWKDPKTEEEKNIVVDKDDGIRAGVSVASLAQLRPAFKRGGTTTAGNSSQVRSSLASSPRLFVLGWGNCQHFAVGCKGCARVVSILSIFRG